MNTKHGQLVTKGYLPIILSRCLDSNDTLRKYIANDLRYN